MENSFQSQSSPRKNAGKIILLARSGPISRDCLSTYLSILYMADSIGHENDRMANVHRYSSISIPIYVYKYFQCQSKQR